MRTPRVGCTICAVSLLTISESGQKNGPQLPETMHPPGKLTKHTPEILVALKNGTPGRRRAAQPRIAGWTWPDDGPAGERHAAALQRDRKRPGLLHGTVIIADD